MTGDEAEAPAEPALPAVSAVACRGCGKPLVLCPMCLGDDPHGGMGQAGYYICKTEDCDESEACCGC